MGLDRRDDDAEVADELAAERVGKSFKEIDQENTASLKIRKPIAEISKSMEGNLDPLREDLTPTQLTFQFMAAKIYENRNNIGKASVTASKALPLAGGTIAGAINFNSQAMTNVDINSGTIDGCDITVGEGKTLELRNGTVNFSTAQNQAIVSAADGAEIDNCVIGGTTAAAGTFTNLTATGDTTLGNATTDKHVIEGNITASGNISSSGGESTFGQVVNLEGTDPRLRLKAKGANHPGVEWYEDTTRKWVVYNDPDESDKLVFKNDSTELLKLTQNGHLGVTEEIYHIDDTDTKITFTTDDINITVGGVNMVDFTEGGTDEVTFNEAGADLDFRIESDDDTKAFYIDAGNNAIQLGSAATTHVTASGAISASGNVTAPSYTGQIVALDRLNYYVTVTSGEADKYHLGRNTGIESGDFNIVFDSPFSIDDEDVYLANILPVPMATIGLKTGVRVSGGGTAQLWITTGSRSDWATADAVPLGFGGSGSVTLANGQDFANLDIAEFDVNANCDAVYLFVRTEDSDAPSIRVTGQLYGRTL